MVLAFLLLMFVIIVGPTMAIITGFFSNLAAYLQYLPALSNPVGRTDANFSQGWTSFYWAWWISWSPFVGMFIARVSRGRTVREFIICVLLIPSLVSVLWMTAFGGTAISCRAVRASRRSPTRGCRSSCSPCSTRCRCRRSRPSSASCW
ncbi:MAG: BCCT family transporter [Thalassobaculum sp.]